jgi:hypothetical protein
MEPWMVYAIIGAFVAFIPGGSFLLILLEAYMVSQIAHKHNISAFGEVFKFVGAVAGISFVLKGAAGVFYFLPVIGEFGNSIFAFIVIWAIAKIATQHFAKLESKRATAVQPQPQPLLTNIPQPQHQLPSPLQNQAQPLYVAARSSSTEYPQERAISQSPSDPMQRRCASCQSWIDANAAFCGFCGARSAE